MNLREIYRSLISNKIRAILAMLGICIASASIVGLLYSGILATEASLKQIEAMGTQLLSVSVVDQKANGYNFKQINKVQNRHKSIKSIIPIVKLHENINIEFNNIKANFLLVTPDIMEAGKLKLHSGRFLRFADIPMTTCVIGDKVFNKLKKHGVLSVIGKKISFGNGSCLVVGRMQKNIDNFFIPEDLNNSVISHIPKSFSGVKDLLVNFKQGVNVMDISSYIIGDLKSIISNKNIFSRTPQFLINHIKNQKNNMQWLLGVIAGISLLVGGIGIMNIMLISVLERRQEIGLRLAIGANKNSIIRLFLFESLLLCAVGGILGISIGLCFSLVVAHISHWTFSWHIWPILLGLFSSSLAGVLFGYYPAKKAANMDPIECIKIH